MSLDDKVIGDWRRDIQGDEAVYPGYRQKLLLLLDEVERLRRALRYVETLADHMRVNQQGEPSGLNLIIEAVRASRRSRNELQ